MTGMERGFEGIQRRCLTDAVNADSQAVHVPAGSRMTSENHPQRVAKTGNIGGYLMGREPGGHLHRERDQQHHVANHCRVKRIVTQSTVQLFGDNHRKRSAQHDHPPRRKRRNTDRQQQAGQQR